MPKIKIAPSIACSDFRNLHELMHLFERNGIDYVHYDVMDGHFVPNITFGPEIFKKMKAMTSIPFDIHLMIENPDKYIPLFCGDKDDFVIVHAESTKHLDRTIQLIRDLGSRPGIAINPATPISAIELVLNKVDLVCVMTVNPGFSGQRLVPYTIEKIRDLKNVLESWNLDVEIEVDGNVSYENMEMMIGAGASILVAGTACLFLKDKPVEETMMSLKNYLDKFEMNEIDPGQNPEPFDDTQESENL
jgi:ribulose-phosphate 3-epimerase